MPRNRLAIAGLLVAAIGVGFVALEAGQRALPEFGRRVSPHEAADGVIDGATLTMVYGRPTMRGRKIMGALVPYNRWWCPGADEATELTTSKALQIGDLMVPAGTYTLYMIPRAADWTLMLNKRIGMFHTRYVPEDDLGHVMLNKRQLDMPVEQLTFSFEPRSAGGGSIVMRWETTEVSAPFTVVP